MDILLRRWTSLIILLVILKSSVTQNLDTKWNKFNTDDTTKKTTNILNDRNIVRKLELNLEPTKNSNPNRNLEGSDAKGTTSNNYSNVNEQDKPHSRQKRLIWVTDDGRLALPPGTTLSISPTIALPFVRYPPSGFLSNMTISLPLTIDFDKLGLTDNQNPLGTIPDYLGRSMGRAAGSMLGQYIAKYLHTRKKRALSEKQPEKNGNFNVFTEPIDEHEKDEDPELPHEHKDAFHGGERALLYMVVEDFLSNFGLDGKACLLRAICEVHSKPVHQLGLLGEMLHLFFTASKSPYSELLDDYVSAEKMGQGSYGPGECFPYFKECPKSLFKSKKNKYYNEDHANTSQKDDKPSYVSNDIDSGPIVM